MNHWVTSDWHLDHKNINKYSKREFSSIEEMNEIIIENVNYYVRPNDHLYFLGDLCFSRDINRVIYWLKRINCSNIFIILGNHDYILKKYKNSLDKFSTNVRSINNLKEIEIEKTKVVLCHYALRVWNKAHYGAYHLYGHSHGSLPDDSTKRSFDVGVDCYDLEVNWKKFTPISWEQIKEKMNKKTFVPIDRHGVPNYVPS